MASPRALLSFLALRFTGHPRAVSAAIGANCTPFVFPPFWFANVTLQIPPPWSAIFARGGGTLDGIAFANSTNGSMSLSIGGTGGWALGAGLCQNGAKIVGFSWGQESSLSFQYPSYSGLNFIGPFACSDGTTNGSLSLRGTAGGVRLNYSIDPSLCGWPVSSVSATMSASVLPSPSASFTAKPSADLCVPFRMPPNWPTNNISAPPYLSMSARGGGTLDRVAMVNATGGWTQAGANGGAALFPPTVFCAAGAMIVGFAWQRESDMKYQMSVYSGINVGGAHWRGTHEGGDGTCVTLLERHQFF